MTFINSLQLLLCMEPVLLYTKDISWCHSQFSPITVGVQINRFGGKNLYQMTYLMTHKKF